MKLSHKLWLGFLLLSTSVSALFEDDAGHLDFMVETTGHAVTRFAESLNGILLTSDGTSKTSSSCYVAGRSTEDGSLLWRRNVCATPSDGQNHAIATLGKYFYTVDDTSTVRAWTIKDGNLLWDAKVPSTSGKPQIWTFVTGGKGYVIVPSDEELNILEAGRGAVVDTIHVLKSLSTSSQTIKSGEHFEWLFALPNPSNSGNVSFLISFVKDGITTGGRMVMLELEIGNDEIVSTKTLSHVKSSIVASSVQPQLVGTSWQGIALATDGSPLSFSLESQSSKTLPVSQFKKVTSIRSTSVPSVISIQGVDEESLQESQSVFRFDSGSWQDVKFSAMAQCDEANLVLGLNNESLKVYREKETVAVTGDWYVPDGDIIEQFSVVECSAESVTALLSTASGTTTLLSLSVSGDSVEVKVRWTAEEGLGSISSAVILDATHLGADDLVEEQGAVIHKLSLSARLESQIDAIASTFSSAGAVDQRDHLFGFVKIAVLLSQKAHRVWGLNTSGSDRGAMKWSLDLPKGSDWHTLVHGTTNSASALHGINGGTHSREILVLSASESSVEWKCIDGTSGAVIAQDEKGIDSPVIQVLPVYGGGGRCRQAALLLHENLSATVVPWDEESIVTVKEHLQKTPNGLYSHFVNKKESKVVSLQVFADGGRFESRQVGQTSFAGERIVKVAYPIRDETVQTMSTVLGDESLLLKYINPHLAVIITMSESENQVDSKIAQSIDKENGKKQTRKPAGAGEVSTSTTTGKNELNMFVNVIDTVSGRVLHRASHSNADSSKDVSALISENWVVYSFVNAVTRRTELGVLTLHEGMIDSKGLTMFSSPEQTTTFSSFDTRESKPVVLAKLYTYPKAITALGATATLGGISSRKIIVASADGKISELDRKMLETRRPVGDVKDEEKKEGLVAYKELIPEIPLFSLSYNKTVESTKSIVSAPTSLESQSLILAFGGPNIFFTRTSPTRGFDLLPDSFSKGLVSFITLCLLIVLLVLKRMGTTKTLKQGWL